MLTLRFHFMHAFKVPFLFVKVQISVIKICKVKLTYLHSFYGKPFYYLLCKVDILYVISDILFRI